MNGLSTEEFVEAPEGHGTSCSWLNDRADAVKNRKGAFRLYEEPGDDRLAARVALWLANEQAEFRGEPAINEFACEVREPPDCTHTR